MVFAAHLHNYFFFLGSWILLPLLCLIPYINFHPHHWIFFIATPSVLQHCEADNFANTSAGSLNSNLFGRTTVVASPNMSAAQPNDAEKNIEIWKVKKLIKRLEAARGNGTSMISLIIRKLSLPSKAGSKM